MGKSELFALIVVILVAALSAYTILNNNSNRPIEEPIQDFERYPREPREKFTVCGGESFCVYPTRAETTGGKKIAHNASLKNIAADKGSHLFVISVQPDAASKNVCKLENISLCAGPDGGSLEQFMKTWSIYIPTPWRADFNQTISTTITFNVPEQTPNGVYLFVVSACYDKVAGEISSEACSPTSPNIWGGSAKQIFIEVV